MPAARILQAPAAVRLANPGSHICSLEDGHAVSRCSVCNGADPLLAAVSATLTDVRAVLDAAERNPDGVVRHALLAQARREFDELVHWHADRLTVAALEAE